MAAAAAPALAATMFEELVHDFETAYMPQLAFPTRQKYSSLLRCHVKPRFCGMRIADIDTRRIDEWLARKTQDGLSWSTRTDLRNLVCSIFTRAELWGIYDGKNPALRATAGRKSAVYEKRKLTVKQTADLLKKLPADGYYRGDLDRAARRPAAAAAPSLVHDFETGMIALFCGLRISEVLGLASWAAWAVNEDLGAFKW